MFAFDSQIILLFYYFPLFFQILSKIFTIRSWNLRYTAIMVPWFRSFQGHLIYISLPLLPEVSFFFVL